MKCHVCGGDFVESVNDMPFKLGPQRIVILKNLPVLQCNRCGEYLLEDPIMVAVERILAKADESAELEILRYAA